METIGIVDRCDGNNTLKKYSVNTICNFNGREYVYERCKKRIERITDALKDIKHTGNINVYLCKGNKTRYLFSKGI